MNDLCEPLAGVQVAVGRETVHVIELRRLTPDNWSEWRTVRLRALEEAPYAFGSTFGEWQGEGDAEARWRNRLESVPLNLIALLEGRPVGQVSGTTRNDRGYVELISMWVAPEARGKGLGNSLIGAVVEWARRQSAEGVVLWVKRSNAKAIAIYERNGFAPTQSPVQDDEQELALRLHPPTAAPQAPATNPSEARANWEGPGVEAWQPWTPDELMALLAGVDAQWCVVGGWAIDLYLGEQTRPHHDLEIAIQREYLPAIRHHLGDFAFHAVGDGTVHRLEAEEAGPLDRHQHWVLDEQAGAWRLDVMVEPGDDEWWVYRRDELVRDPRRMLVDRTHSGIPYLRPQGALLYKAKALLPKDQADFNACLPRMDAAARAWLAGALELLHPGHPWLDHLT